MTTPFPPLDNGMPKAPIKITPQGDLISLEEALNTPSSTTKEALLTTPELVGKIVQSIPTTLNQKQWLDQIKQDNNTENHENKFGKEKGALKGLVFAWFSDKKTSTNKLNLLAQIQNEIKKHGVVNSEVKKYFNEIIKNLGILQSKLDAALDEQ